jgi:hypothetical protein
MDRLGRNMHKLLVFLVFLSACSDERTFITTRMHQMYSTGEFVPYVSVTLGDAHSEYDFEVLKEPDDALY